MTFPPLAEGDKDTGQFQPVHAIVPEMVRVLRFNRGLGKVDRVVTRNGKCLYECVWIESDAPGVWFCAYALDLYGWVHLGDVDRFGQRVASGCTSGPMGLHSRKARRATGTPMTTSRSTNSIRFHPTRARRRLAASMRVAPRRATIA